MKRLILSITSIAVALTITGFAATNGSADSTAPKHKWKFSPTINAPWANEDDEQPLDSPLLAVGMCRSDRGAVTSRA